MDLDKSGLEEDLNVASESRLLGILRPEYTESLLSDSVNIAGP